MERTDNNRSFWSYLCCGCCDDTNKGGREPLRRGETPPQQRHMVDGSDGKGKATTPGHTPEKPKFVKEAKITSTNDYV